MAKSIKLESTSKGLNNILNELNTTNVKMGETVDDVDYQDANSIIANKVNNIDINSYQKIQDNNLATADKTIVGAINELFQNASSGKQLIADAIGSDNIDEESTYEAMSQAIEELKAKISAQNSVKQLESNNENLFLLKDTGELYGLGVNANGELGLGDTNARTELVKLSDNVESVFCGDCSTFIVKNDGNTYACGLNNYGQLGIGTIGGSLNVEADPYICTSGEVSETLKYEAQNYGYHEEGRYFLPFYDYETVQDNGFTVINNNNLAIIIQCWATDDDGDTISGTVGSYIVPANSYLRVLITEWNVQEPSDFFATFYMYIQFPEATGWYVTSQDYEEIQTAAMENIQVYNDSSIIIEGEGLPCEYVSRDSLTPVDKYMDNYVSHFVGYWTHLGYREDEDNTFSIINNNDKSIRVILRGDDVDAHTVFQNAFVVAPYSYTMIQHGSHDDSTGCRIMIDFDTLSWDINDDNYESVQSAALENIEMYSGTLDLSLIERNILNRSINSRTASNIIPYTCTTNGDCCIQTSQSGSYGSSYFQFDFSTATAVRYNGFTIINNNPLPIAIMADAKDDDQMDIPGTYLEFVIPGNTYVIIPDPFVLNAYDNAVTQYYTMLISFPETYGWSIDPDNSVTDIRDALDNIRVYHNFVNGNGLDAMVINGEVPPVNAVCTTGDVPFYLGDGSSFGINSSTNDVGLTNISFNSDRCTLINNNPYPIVFNYHTRNNDGDSVSTNEFIIAPYSYIQTMLYEGQMPLVEIVLRNKDWGMTSSDYQQRAGEALSNIELYPNIVNVERNFENNSDGSNSGNGVTSFTQILNITDVKQISGGPTHTLLVKNDGTLYACGSNEYKQLGVTISGKIECTSGETPYNINFDSAWLDTRSLGHYPLTYSGLYPEDGNDWTIINNNPHNIYFHIHGMTNDADVLVSADYTINSYDYIHAEIPVDPQATIYPCEIYFDPTEWGITEDNHVEIITEAMNNIEIYTSFVTVEQGSSISSNKFIQVTDNINNDVAQVSCGRIHSAILKNDGTIWTCGQLGQSNINSRAGVEKPSEPGDSGDIENNTTFTKIENAKDLGDIIDLDLFNGYTESDLYYDMIDIGGFMAPNYVRLTIEDASNFINDGVYRLRNDNENAIEFYVVDAMGNAVQNVTRFEGNTETEFTIHASVEPIEGAKIFLHLDDWGTIIADNWTSLNAINHVTVYKVQNDDVTLNNITKISSGKNHMVALKNDGSIYSCGSNTNGQLGLGDFNNRNDFHKVNINNVKDIDCIGNTSFALLNDNTLWTCGGSSEGVSEEVISGTGTLIENNWSVQTSLTPGPMKILSTYGTTRPNVIVYEFTAINKNDKNIYIQFKDDEGNFEDEILVPPNGYINYNAHNSSKLDTSASAYYSYHIFAYPADGWSGVDEVVYNEIKANFKVYEGIVTYTPGSSNLPTPLGIYNSYEEYIDIEGYFLKINSTTSDLLETGLAYSFVNKCNHSLTFKVEDMMMNDTIIVVPSNSVVFDAVGPDVCEGDIYVTVYAYASDGWEITQESIQEIVNNTFIYRGEVSEEDIFGYPNVFTTTELNNVKLMAPTLDKIYALNNNDVLFVSSSEGINDLGTFKSGSYQEILCDALIEKGFEASKLMSMFELIKLIEEEGLGDKEVPIKQIACGYRHVMALKENGDLWGAGNNGNGQLGLGDFNSRNTFHKITGSVAQVACGQNHTFILKTDGTVWSCGNNYSNQLGYSSSNTNTFTKVTTNVNRASVEKEDVYVTQVACGSEHTIILKSDGSVWGCGDNSYGQLGVGSGTTKTIFTQATTNINNDVKQIACGVDHTVILKNDGTVWACGLNDDGQLGISSYDNANTFTQATDNAKQVSCGAYFTMIAKNDDSLWASGNNDFGQLGNENIPYSNMFIQIQYNINNDVKKIACGYYFTMIIKNDNSLWACGNTTSDFTKLYSTFTQISDNVKDVDCGEYYTHIIKQDNILYSYGSNGSGQLGIGDKGTMYDFTKTVFTEIDPSEDSEIDESIFPVAWLGNDAKWFVSPIEDAEYGFVDMGAGGYYESQNKGIHNSAAVCRLYIHNPKKENVTLHCTNYAESSYDYGIVSKRNVELSLTHEEDPASNCTVSFKNSNSSLEQQITLDAESGWYYIKFIKDNSNSNNNDSLTFTVSFGSPYAGQ